MQIPLMKLVSLTSALQQLPVLINRPSVVHQEYPPIVLNLLNGSRVIQEVQSTNPASVLYTMSNNPSGNWLHAIPLNTDGTIMSNRTVKYSLNGNGARFPFAGKTIQDALDSQGSIIQSGARLFAVNAGSDTFQAFAINCNNATDLIPLKGPTLVNGHNPTTISVDNADQIACVATTGNITGVACYDYSIGFGRPEIRGPQFFTGTNKTFTLPMLQHGPLPTGPSDTVSQLLFTPDQKYLVAVVKGALDQSGKLLAAGYISTYPLSANGLGAPVRSQPRGSEVLFGCSFKSNSYDLFCTDAALGTVYLKQQPDLTYQPFQSTSKTNFGNGTNCWAASSPYANGPFYVTAVDKNYIASFDKTTGKLLGQHNFTNGNPNLIEMTVAKDIIYALSFGNSTYPPHIAVAQDTNLAGSLVELQNYLIPDVGDCVSGLAAFIPGDSNNICDFI